MTLLCLFLFSQVFSNSHKPIKFYKTKREIKRACITMENTISRRFTNICVFCGSSYGKNREFEEAAEQLGKVLTEKKIRLVYEGGNLGLMGRISKAVYDGESQVLGIIPKTLSVGGVTGNTIGEIQIVSNMHECKADMFS
ncbi:hypothetical protein ACOSP7_002468 [Xanthoceras sorbifolium]